MPDGTVINEFDAAMQIEGVVVDESTDPPFTVGALLSGSLADPAAFGGPATATTNLQNPTTPEPATMILMSAAIPALLRRRRKRA